MTQRKRPCLLLLLPLLLLLSSPLGANNTREKTQYLLIVNLYEQNAFELTTEQIEKFQQAFPSSEYRDRIDFIQARLDQKKGKSESARQKYTDFLRHYTRSTLRDKATFYLGETLFGLENYSEALLNFQRLLLDFPKSPYAAHAHYWNAETAYALSDYDRARQGYEQYLTRYPKGTYRGEASYGLGWSYLQLNNPAQAEAAFQMIVTQNPQSTLLPAARFYAGVSLFKQHQYGKAKEAFSMILETQDSAFWHQALFYIGECWYKLGKYQQAESFYQEALTNGLLPQMKEQALYSLGWARLAQKKYAKALSAFRQAAANFPHGALKQAAIYEQGVIHEKQQAYQKAEAIYRSLLDPETVSADLREAARFGLMKIFFQEKRFPQTIEQGELYDTHYPQGTYADSVILYRGESYYLQQQYDRAIGQYQQLLQQHPQSIFLLDAWYKLGLSFIKQGQLVKAQQTLQAFLEKFPHSLYDQEASFTLAELYFKNKNYPQALIHYQNLLDQQHLSAALREKATLGLSWTVFKQGNYQQALQAFSKIQQDYPNSPFMKTVIFKKAECLSNLKQFKNAIREFSHLTERFPSSSFVSEAQFQIGMAYYKMNDFAKAIYAFDGLIQSSTFNVQRSMFTGRGSSPTSNLEPRTLNLELKPKAIFWTGWSYYRQADYQKAYLAFARLTKQPNTIPPTLLKEATLRQADCLFNLRRFKEAFSRYKKVTNFPGEMFAKDALYGMFLSQLELEDFTEAKTVWKKFVVLYPQDPLVIEMDEKMIEKKNL